jgi:thiol-disulfide isomerase/thioredoxin
MIPPVVSLIEPGGREVAEWIAEPMSKRPLSLKDIYSYCTMKGVPLDLALFSATAAAFVAHLHYQRMPCRRARTNKQVSFRLDKLEAVHPSIAAMMPSLELSKSKYPPIMGLLFAASWCPDCFDVVPAVGKVAGTSSQSLVEIIYVSSDTSEIEMLKFKPTDLKYIPFDAVQERSELKRKFRTCAAKEMNSLGLADRKNGIPTLILLESSTGRIVTENGVDHVMKSGSPESVLDGWRSMLSRQKCQ